MTNDCLKPLDIFRIHGGIVEPTGRRPDLRLRANRGEAH